MPDAKVRGSEAVPSHQAGEKMHTNPPWPHAKGFLLATDTTPKAVRLAAYGREGS